MRWVWVLLLFLSGCCSNCDSDSINVFFCPEEDCLAVLNGLISNSSDVVCALYSLSDETTINNLNKNGGRVFLNNKANYLINKRIDRKKSLMHDKFCVFDSKIVFTGSMNPTKNADSDFNNILVIHSKEAARIFKEEFELLWSGQDRAPRFNTILKINSTILEVYFCPRDWCASKAIESLSSAKSSINFAIYSFTHNKISDVLLSKYNQNLEVSGIVEKSQNSKWSEFDKIRDFTELDSFSSLLHHKFFVIDNETVLTGSFNPTRNGDLFNNENLLIIHNKDIANKFSKEFDILLNSNN